MQSSLAPMNKIMTSCPFWALVFFFIKLNIVFNNEEMYQAAREAVIGVVCGASRELKHGAHRNSRKDAARLGGV